MTCDYYILLGLILLFLTLMISVSLNVVLFIRQRASLCKDKVNCCYPHNYEGERRSSQEENDYFHDLNHHEQQENPHNHREQQENPIYGNISTDRGGSAEVCYETMNIQHTGDRLQEPLPPDLNYASLDLKMAKKRKKKTRHQQDQAQRRNSRQDHLPAHLTPPVNAFMEAEGDMDAHLPSRDTSTMVSQSSIYLNSQQIAQETVETERERSMNMKRDNGSWEGTRRQEDGGAREWREEQKGEGRKDAGNWAGCTQFSEVQAIQGGTDHFIIS